MKRAVTVAVLSMLAGAASAADLISKDAYVGGLIDYQIQPDNKIKDAINNGYGLDLIYGDRSMSQLPIGYEAHLFYDTSKVKDAFGGGNISRTGLGLDATYPFALGSGLTPFVLGGVGAEEFKFVDESKVKAFAEIGAGLLWAIPDSSNWRVRADLRWVDNFTSPDLRDLWLKIGAEYSFGGGSTAKPAEESVGVVPAVEKPVQKQPEPAMAEPAAEPAKEGAPKKVITLKGVQFASNSDQLKPESTGALDEAAKTLNADPDAKVEVAGHTDDRGDAAHNKELSKRRAKAVMDYLVQQGVDAKRLTAEGYGSEQPVADNKTKAGRAKNRRVELRIK